MGWGDPHIPMSVGTTQQIEDAHKKLDEIGIMPGPLASRAEKAARLVAQFVELEKPQQPTPPIEEWTEPTLDDHITLSHDDRL